MTTSTTFNLLAVALGVASVACSNDSPTSPSTRGVRAPARSVTERRAGTNFTSFEVPGSVGTLALDINASGTIVGRYFAPTTPLTTHAFVRTPDGVISSFDFPGASFTVAAGINARGDIVGQYALPSAPRARHGYLLRAGVFTSLDPEGSTFTNVLGINDRGDIVGRYCSASNPANCGAPGGGAYRGFLLSDGQFTNIDVPGGGESDAWKINSGGTIVGGFVTATHDERLFVLREGNYTEIALPNDRPVSLDNGGQNARGDIVGLYCDGAPPCLIVPTATHGFLLSGDGFETIDYPGAVATSVIGINSRGDIVGGWFDAAQHIRGFVLTREGDR